MAVNKKRPTKIQPSKEAYQVVASIAWIAGSVLFVAGSAVSVAGALKAYKDKQKQSR
ncbi:hypothetical protein AAC03nite_07560 [Alicyclobacillus acidoterrestris]|uniref:hypothetical protein n=1 Tax=Alicyclobacillus suci TaxID=2816080 RepID=UPI0011970D38|nr:hypothetical protein [Alicyclobacillus suci]GEO24971.1 hypothetical protein AAC03nite_07560 [Alicyclobacillus acidoterrestris]